MAALTPAVPKYHPNWDGVPTYLPAPKAALPLSPNLGHYEAN